MGSPAFAVPPGFTEAEDQSGPVQGQTAPIPAGTPSLPEASPLNYPAAPPGFEEYREPPPPEPGYFKQVGDRLSSMAADMYDAWEKGDFPRMTGVPGLIEGVNKQYYDTLWRSQSPSEFLLNLVPIFGPIANNAISEAAQGRPKTSAAILTTDILLPLLAEKLPSAAWSALPKSVTAGNLPERLMYSALKPTISKKEKVAAASQRAVRTAIDEGIAVSEGGLQKLTGETAKINTRREEIIGGAPKPQMVLEPKEPQPALPQGGAPDFELGPTVPPPGTRQTILSHARGQLTPPSGAQNLGEFMGGIRESYTAQPTKPGVVRLRLEQAGNQQLIDAINRRAQESGLLDAVQEAARKAGQPVPYDISEVFNISFKNVIDPKKVAARLEQLKKRYKTVNPEADFAAIDAARDEFLRNYPAPMSYKQAQSVRAATSRKVGEAPYLAQTNPAKVQAEVAMERIIMSELKEALPELKALNAREHKLLGLEPELRRALGRTKNWELWSGIQAATAAAVGGTVGTVLGGAYAGAPSAAIASALAMALRDPMVKSKLAIALNRAQKLFPKKFGAPSVAAAEAKVNAYLADLESQLGRGAAGALATPSVRTPGTSEPEEEGQP